MTNNDAEQHTDKYDWEANIENMTERVAFSFGTEVAASVFARYDATCFDDLSPDYFGQVFGDLMLIDSDG